MRRLYFQRYDLWLSLALSFLVSLGTVWLANQILDKTYLDYVESHEVAGGEIGGVAGADVFRAQNVEDLLSHDTFTVVSPGSQYMSRGAGYFGNWYLYALTLPSGERVAAVINFDSLVRSGEDIYSGETTLPVGRIVYEDLESSETFLSQIEHSTPLDRHDFYIDMMGSGGRLSEEDYRELPLLAVRLGTILVCFPIFHLIGSKLGVFPYFFPPRERKPKKKKDSEMEWEYCKLPARTGKGFARAFFIKKHNKS